MKYCREINMLSLIVGMRFAKHDNMCTFLALFVILFICYRFIVLICHHFWEFRKVNWLIRKMNEYLINITFMTLQENILFTNPYLQKKIMCPINRRSIICLISPHHLIILFFCRTHHFLRYLLIIRLLIGSLIYWLLIILN